MGRLEGKVALVSGAASGIGRATAAALAREGATVVVADVDEAGSAETCREIDRAGGVAEAVHLDVTQEDDWARAIDGIKTRHGALHILVNNAALCIRARILDMDLATWRRQNAVNLDGVFLGSRAAIPLMAASGGGAIVNVSSVAGLQGIPGLTGYCASKGGVRLFTKALALECAGAGNNIRVNSVHPGTIETPIWAKMLHGGDLPEGTNSVEEIMEQTRVSSAKITPLGRAGQPSDIAEGVVYLCSDAASFVTGAELVIDGGVFAN
jgi:NAD(P)-dependent dehydrogenase (short-subunit alcohol dehydrogenase family)